MDYETMTDEELNKLVAERRDKCGPRDGGTWGPPPYMSKPWTTRDTEYCGRIELAWKLVKDMLIADWRSTISTPGAFTDEGLGGEPIIGSPWAVSVKTPSPSYATFEDMAADTENERYRHVYATAATVERAIVLAWLRLEDARREGK